MGFVLIEPFTVEFALDEAAFSLGGLAVFLAAAVKRAVLGGALLRRLARFRLADPVEIDERRHSLAPIPCRQV